MTPSKQFEDFKATNKSYNSEFIDSFVPYLEWILIVMIFARLLFPLICFWKPTVIKYVFWYQMLYVLLNQTLPRDYGEFHGRFLAVVQYMNFVQYYVDFRRHTIAIICVNTFILVCIRSFIYREPLGQQILYSIGNCCITLCTCVITHACLSWVCQLYVAADVSRTSNENMLHGLKESVFIIEKQSDQVMFQNSAASRLIRHMRNYNSSFIVENKDIKATLLDKKRSQFKIFDMAQLKEGNYRLVTDSH